MFEECDIIIGVAAFFKNCKHIDFEPLEKVDRNNKFILDANIQAITRETKRHGNDGIHLQFFEVNLPMSKFLLNLQMDSIKTFPKLKFPKQICEITAEKGGWSNLLKNYVINVGEKKQPFLNILVGFSNTLARKHTRAEVNDVDG